MDEHPIVYREYPVCKDLAPFIDAFWTVTGANTADRFDRILPDGCVDIIFNFGPTFLTEQGATEMYSGEAYLVGTMTRFKEMVRPPATRLLGVRFQPGGFSCFYDASLLRSTADRTVLFDRSLFPSSALDRFFLDRLKPPSNSPLPLIRDIQLHRGCISVDRLAKRHFMTIRSMERLFDRHLAIGPKEFINFIRYRSAMESIRLRQGKSLLDIACGHGYYDHAHLTNEIKKYTGSSPSDL